MHTVCEDAAMSTGPGRAGNEIRDSKLPVVIPQSGDGRPEDVAIGLVVIGARVGWRAGRVALAPLRAAGRITGTTRRVRRVTGGVGAEGRSATSRDAPASRPSSTGRSRARSPRSSRRSSSTVT